ncbi:uncharacterized protein LOC111242777 [Vigna radiata var. radiata]|uniref:Uncharacterized protein LOC111242777 n=1 Tax=Vigna radiata var. radiata TaxID=3916 RepID=A0A3Q0FHT1_VIGRR|nr:uncharacterized protein LOC111242777 [Vigna radiata var. radiata]
MNSKGREKSLDRARRGGKEEFLQDNKKGKKEVKKGRDAMKDSLQNIKKAKKFSEEGEYLANDKEKKEERYPHCSAKWRTTQEIKEMLQNIKIQIKDLARSEKSVMKGKKEGKMGRDVVKGSMLDIKTANKPSWKRENSTNGEKKRETNISEEGNVVTITLGSRMSEVVVLSVDGFAGIRGQDRRKGNICEEEGNDENCDGDIGVASVEKVAEFAAIIVDNVTNVGRENTLGEDQDGKVVTFASPSKVAKAVVFSKDRVVGCGMYVKTIKKGEELCSYGVKTLVSRSDPAVVWVSMGASTRAVTDPYPETTEVITPADLASSNSHKGFPGFLQNLY